MALIQHWKCQDNAASTVIVATAGTNATLSGGDNTSAITIVDGPGTAFPRSLDLDGANDYFDVSGASISIASGSAWSVGAWFKLDSTATNQGIFGILGATTCRVILSSATLVRCNVGGSTNRDFTVPSISTAAWHHILVTRSAANALRVFVDGVESSTGAITVAESFAPTLVGRSNTLRLNGPICDVRVYDSDESANVAAIMAEKNAGGASIVPIVMHLARMRR